MRGKRIAHWELAAVAHAGVLAAWLVWPAGGWALVAALTAVAAVGLAVRARRPGAIVAALVAAAGAWAAASTSRRVGEVEREWDTDSTGVRWQLVDAAGATLDAELEEAVSAVKRLADDAASVSGATRTEGFARLAAAVRGPGPERGVTVLDSAGRPWIWAGRHRLPPAAPTADLDARITPFYATLDGWRQGSTGGSVRAHVVLAADSAVPDRASTLAARFARATGVELEFFPPGRGPYWADVFDYCRPSCNDTTAVPDTLFSVLMLPPSQGAYKLRVLERGGRRVAVLGSALLVAVAVFGGMWARVLAVGALGAFLVLTPAGTQLRLGTLFSPALYFSELLGPLTGSAGALLVSASLALLLAATLWRRGVPPTPFNLLGAAILIVAAPVLLRALAAGITPPTEGSDLVLWVQWEIPVTVATAAMLVFAAALVRSVQPAPAPRWMAFLAGGWAAGAAVLGLVVWAPGVGWPAWYLYLWLPAIALAVQPASGLRVVATVAVVAGTAAALLTWGAASDGRLLLAERDLGGLRQGGDPVAVGLLERFGARVQEEQIPRNAAELYSRWSRSSLFDDRYPAALTTWSGSGAIVATLELAELDLPRALLREAALAAAGGNAPAVTQVSRVPGMHYVLTVPFPDGSVVTVGLGPRSRVIPPARIARFLRGEPVLAPPYEISITEPIVGTDLTPGGATWRRDGWSVRGEERLEFPEGARHLHTTLALGGLSSLVVRGTLVTVVDVALIVLLWLASEALAGTVRVAPVLRRLTAVRTYRARLGVAFAAFFVVPTVGFAAWTANRIAGEAGRSRDIMIRQTLRDAAGTVSAFPAMPQLVVRDLLSELSSQLSAELVVYNGGALQQASAPVLVELGVLDRLLDPDVFSLLARDEIEAASDQQVAGRDTRVGYRTLGGPATQAAVLAAPRLVEDPVLIRAEQDLVFGLILVTLAGIVAAAVLSALAAGTLSQPVQALREAAVDVGRGEVPSPFSGDAPGEFVPVMRAFERMANDVNATRAALEAQRRSTAAVLRNVATGVVALDERLAVTMANPRADELLGRHLAVGRSVVEAAPPAWQPVWEWVRTNKDRAEAEPREFTLDERQIRVQVARLAEAGRGCVVALDDTTDLARAVRVLAWGELARQIAHEIKNPLTPIRLGIQHLRRAYDSPRGDYPDTLDKTSRQMLDEIERLDAIARAFSRFGAPAAEAEPLADVDVAAVARDAAALYTLGDGEGVSVDAASEVAGRARQDELKEVLINLIENARTAGAGTITIAVTASDREVSLAVRDDGEGIPPEHLPRIFEPQFSTTTSGTGLGLAICKRLVESWGGSIQVASAPGYGTTVTIGCAAAGAA